MARRDGIGERREKPRSDRNNQRDTLAGPMAALDLGTNNCRLLIAEPNGADFRVIDSFSRVTKLGGGVAERHWLSDAAMDRTLAALHICAQKIERHGVTDIKAVATDACRRAINSDDFVKRIYQETGLVIETIDAEREAELAFNGCSPLITGVADMDAPADRVLVFDIGGGSTEIAWTRQTNWCGKNGLAVARDLAIHSIPFGVLTLSEQFDIEAICRDGFEHSVALIDRAIAEFDHCDDIAKCVAANHVQMVGTSGTVTTLAGIHKNLIRYVRRQIDGTHLDFADIERLSHEIAAMDPATRARNRCIGVDRADLIVAGCSILLAICRRWPVGHLRVGDRGLREGILLELTAARRAMVQAD